MSLIPADLRAPFVPAVRFSGVSQAVVEYPTARTYGIAAAALVPSIVGLGGLKAASLPDQACAVAVTRIERRGRRIWGALCAGTGPVGGDPESRVARFSHSATLGFGPDQDPPTRPDGSIFYGRKTFTNPWPTTARAVLQVYSGVDFSFLDISGRTSLRRQPFFSPSTKLPPCTCYLDLAPGQSFSLIARGVLEPGVGNRFFVFATFSRDTAADWRPAVPRLAWSLSGLTWWGQVDAAARSGVWVRRAAWGDLTRKVRFEAGAGTTPAVAVQSLGGASDVVTTADFTTAEWVAEDWVIQDSAEPRLMDVTDLRFAAPSWAAAFVVDGSPIIPPPPSATPVTPPPSAPLPAAGEGFVFMRGGQPILVPAKDCQGGIWSPQ